jgi:hypothetical protein
VYNYLTNKKEEFVEHRNHSPAPRVTFLKITAVSRNAFEKSDVLWEHGAWGGGGTAAGNINHRQIMLPMPSLKQRIKL